MPNIVELVGFVDLALIVLGLAFCFVVRLPFHALLPLRFERGLPAGDLSGVLSKIENMSRRRWPGYEVPDSVLPGFIGYPVLFHWLVARFPQPRWRLVSVVLNILPDCIAAITVYFAVFYLLGARGSDMAEGSSPRLVALLAMALLLTLPILLPVNARMMTTNGRAFGGLLAQLCLVAMYLSATLGSWWAGGIAVMFAVLTILTSMFGMQVVAFFSLPLSLMLGSPAPLLIVGSAGALAWFMPVLGAREILRFKYHHFRWYRRNVDKVFAETNARSLVHCFVLFVRETRAGRAGALSRLNRRSPVLISLYSLPPLLLMVWPIGPDGLRAGMADPLVGFCLVITAAAGATFVLTATRMLTEWGQAERYWEAAAPAIVIAVAALTVPEYGAVLLLAMLLLQIAILVLMHVYGALAVQRRATTFPAEKFEFEVFAYLESLAGQGGVVLTLPQQLQHFWARYTRRLEGLPFKYIFTGILPPAGTAGAGFDYIDRVFTDSPQYPSMSPRELQRAYGLRYVIALNGFCEARRGRVRFIDQLADEAEVVFANEKYTVYRVSDVG